LKGIKMTQLYAEKSVTHTYTSPQGVVVVVSGVPATVVSDSDGKPVSSYPFKAALKLEEIIQDAMRRDASPGKVHTIPFDNAPAAPVADIEFKIRGPQILPGETSLKVWKASFDRISLAVKNISKTLAEHRGSPLPPSPPVAYALPGSLIIGLKSSGQNALLKDSSSTPEDVSLESMRLMLDASRWVEGDETALSSEVLQSPRLMEAALRAVEEIAPREGDSIVSVELSDKRFRSSEDAETANNNRVTLKAGSRERATKRRIEIALKDGSTRSIAMRGIIDQLKLDGIFHIKEVSSESDLWKSPVAKIRYPEHLRTEIHRLFGKQVTLEVIQREINGTWSDALEVLSISDDAIADLVSRVD
jgi:hypothetical protein